LVPEKVTSGDADADGTGNLDCFHTFTKMSAFTF